MDLSATSNRAKSAGDPVPGPADPREAGLQGAIAALAAHASLETSTRDLDEIDGYAALLPLGTEVFATWIPGRSPEHIAALSARLRNAGMHPVPHLAAREIRDAATLESLLVRLQKAEVDRVLVIGGDAAQPAGPFSSAQAVLETGALQNHGIRGIAIAAYPEGHPKIGADALWNALDSKLAYAADHGLTVTIVTQFCFDGDAILAWLRALRERGVGHPVRVGLAGPAGIKALLRFAAQCGVGNSVRAIGNRTESVGRLLTRQGPEPIVRKVAPESERLGISGLHLFPFGGFAETAHWLRNVAAGRFALGTPASGFVVE